MKPTGFRTLRLSESEGQFLHYVACRIDWEVGRLLRGEQGHLRTLHHLRLLAQRALEILGDSHELDAWLEAATRVRELPWAFPTLR